jgi:hypothetical protein
LLGEAVGLAIFDVDLADCPPRFVQGADEIVDLESSSISFRVVNVDYDCKFRVKSALECMLLLTIQVRVEGFKLFR